MELKITKEGSKQFVEITPDPVTEKTELSEYIKEKNRKIENIKNQIEINGSQIDNNLKSNEDLNKENVVLQEELKKVEADLNDLTEKGVDVEEISKIV